MYKDLEGFNWDTGNVEKIVKKHGVTPEEAEEVFIDPSLVVSRDVRHSSVEERFVALGKIKAGTLLFVVFTLRSNLLRVISARTANKKDKADYGTKNY